MKRDIFHFGFTLVELMIVLVILGILVAIALPNYSVVVERSRQAEAISVLGQVHASQLRYYYEHDSMTWPATVDDLDMNISNLKYFTGPYIEGGDGDARLYRDYTSGWDYIVKVDQNGTFSYDTSIPGHGKGPGGLPQ